MYIYDGVNYYKVNLGTSNIFLEARSYDAAEMPSHLTIPETIDNYPIRSINFSTFSGSKLESIEIPDSVWYIGKNAFRNCTKLKHVKFYKSVNGNLKGFVRLCAGAFLGCVSLEELSSELKLAKVGTQCFSGCINFRFLNAAVSELQGLALENCISLQSLLLEDKCVIASTALKGCKSLKDLLFLGDVSTSTANSMIEFLKKKTIWCTKESNVKDFAYDGCDIHIN
jgi:hypothetical protein